MTIAGITLTYLEWAIFGLVLAGCYVYAFFFVLPPKECASTPSYYRPRSERLTQDCSSPTVPFRN
jgi:hypothetical protein